ncbi:MAG: ABC transporter substrate-binding protein [Chloroflexota bacterium]|nr:ABC transporter substrate-binding protein [Chloroflexota bacterium]
MVRLPHILAPTRRPFWASLLVSVLILVFLSGCGAGSAANSVFIASGSQSAAPTQVKAGGTVVIDNVSGSLWTCNFNPYSTSTSSGQGLSAGVFYEPLYYINALTGKQSPWLASGYYWSNGKKTLTFTIRSGVKWSDGKPLTAKDVAFTFNLLKKFSGLDLQAVWTVLSSVQQRGNTVVFKFQKPSVPFFYYIAGQNYILPEHIWSKVKNPVTDTNPKPVGSGPFLLSKCSPQDVIYVRNPHFWQAPKPYIDKVEYPAFLGNQAGNLYLAQGQANYGGQYIPNVKTYYLARDPVHRHIWYPPSADLGLWTNLKVWPLTILKVRQALSYGIDRSLVSRLGVYGYLPPANQAGIVVPGAASWYDASQAAKYNYSYQPNKAMALLRAAGFKRGAGGIWEQNGRKLSLTMINVSGFTDWIAEAAIVKQSLARIGIQINTRNLSGNDVTTREQQGHFQLAYGSGSLGAGPTPYYWYHQLLDSSLTANIGQTATSNYDRYRSAATDRLLADFNTTTNPAVQHRIVDQLQKVMLTQVPFVPLLEEVNWFQYDTSKLVGWPSASNPYANPSPYNVPDWEVVLSSIHMK